MSEDHDPLAETRQYHAIDPYEIAHEDEDPPVGFRTRLARLGAMKLAALATGLVLVVSGIAWGTSAALASSGSSSAAPAAPGDSTPSATSTDTAKKAHKAVRVKITQLAAGSFTGTTGKDQVTVTVVFGADTKFGNKAHPLTPDQLAVGMTVTVAGDRKGDTITAASIAVPVKKAQASAMPTSSS